MGVDERTESVGTEIVPSVVDVTEEYSGSLDFHEIQGTREMEEINGSMFFMVLG